MSLDIELEDLGADLPKENPTSKTPVEPPSRRDSLYDDSEMYSAIFTAVNASEANEKKSAVNRLEVKS